MYHVAFLRGINVGKRRVTGEQLCSPFEILGLANVTSFLASGNVMFSTTDTADLETRIETTLHTKLGFTVDAFVRNLAEVAEIAEHRPFPEEVVAASSGKLQVTFLRSQPNQAAIAAAMEHATDDDRLAILGRHWYWLPADGISTSSLDITAVEGALGRGTTRTLNTVTRVHAKLQAA